MLQRSLLWCLVLFGAAHILLSRVRVTSPVSALPAHVSVIIATVQWALSEGCVY